MPKSVKDLASGLVFITFGLAFGIAASRYQIGTAFRMGPGYFPIVLAGALVLLGAIIATRAFFAGDRTSIGILPWRALLLLLGAILFFGVTVRGLGLGPSVFATVLMAAFASRLTTVRSAVLIALGLLIGCLIIFAWALGLTVPVIGPWLAPFLGS